MPLPQTILKSFFQSIQNRVVLFLIASLCFSTTALAAESEKIPGMKWADWKEFFDKSPRHQWAVGGGGNVALATNNTIDTIAGGTVKARYTFHNAFSLESSVDFNRFDARKIDGDIFSIPFLQTFLLHTPYFNKVSYYLQSGVGYQFNEDKDLELAGVGLNVEDGVIVTAGAGADYKLSEQLFLNLDLRYQFADFDIKGPSIKKGGAFDTVVCRLSLMWRF